MHCRILSVFFTLQDTNMSLLHSPLGSGAVCSNSIQCSFFPHPNDVAHPNTHGKRGRAPEYSCTHGKHAGKFKVLEYGKRGKALEYTGTKLATSVHLPSLCSSFRKAPDHSISSISSMWPHIGRQSLSPTITFGCFHSHSVSSQSMQVLSPGGDSSCSWVLVRALGHNLDERRDFTFTSPAWGVQSDREYTRLHN